MLRVIREVKPAYVVGENVAGIVSMENGKTLDRILAEGYFDTHQYPQSYFMDLNSWRINKIYFLELIVELEQDSKQQLNT